jgi:hypothetical protein
MSFHSLPFNLFHKQIDIMLSTNDIHTLANVVIFYPTQANLVSCAISFYKVVAQVKKLYHD